MENKTYLGVVDPIEKQLYLFNKEGILTNKVLKGNTEFVVGKLNKNASASLLIGLDKSLFSYPLD